MPVYHFTFHAYRSWNTDHPKGWVQHGETETKPPSKALARHRNKLAKFPEVRFTPHQQSSISNHVKEICTRRGWNVYAISADSTHLHIVIAWQDAAPMEKVRDTVKRVTGYLLAKDAGTKGKPWFSHGASDVPVHGRRHLRYLLYEYLPKHLGVFWRRELEGE